MTKTILVVEHQAGRRVVLEECLTKEGFQLLLAGNSDEALSVALETPPDLILLDLMMPNGTGYQFLREYRRKRNTPIITMTEKKEESEAVTVFELGADDVVTKPLRMRELVARIHALLRRSKQAIDRLEGNDIVLDRVSRTVTVRGVAVNLTPTEFHLLAILISQAGHAVPHQTLFERLVLVGYAGSKRSIKGHVRNLRQKIEADPAYPSYINTVFGVGYRFGSGGPLF
ncbi:MAG: response regulator transcription factor [Ardenticatenaceae bacterium]